MTVRGAEALRRRFKAIPDKLRQGIADAMEKQAEAVCVEMRRLAPKGETGKLTVSIGWTWGAAPKGSISLGAVAPDEKSLLRITIYAGGDDAFYARFQEFGTQKMVANPFFWPTWRKNRTKVRAGISRAVGKALRDA